MDYWRQKTYYFKTTKRPLNHSRCIDIKLIAYTFLFWLDLSLLYWCNIPLIVNIHVHIRFLLLLHFRTFKSLCSLDVDRVLRPIYASCYSMRPGTYMVKYSDGNSFYEHFPQNKMTTIWTTWSSETLFGLQNVPAFFMHVMVIYGTTEKCSSINTWRAMNFTAAMGFG